MFDNLNAEEKLKLSNDRSDKMKVVWSKMNGEEYCKRCQAQRDRWAKLTYEEKCELLKVTREAQRKYMLSDYGRKHMSEINKEIWNKMNKEEKDRRISALLGGSNKFTEREKIDYNDSQRPYQVPDGMEAYIIKCYDDILINSIVCHIGNNINISFQKFIEILTEMFNAQNSSDNHRSSTTIDQL